MSSFGVCTLQIFTVIIRIITYTHKNTLTSLIIHFNKSDYCFISFFINTK